jgi:hypothetical protein
LVLGSTKRQRFTKHLRFNQAPAIPVASTSDDPIFHLTGAALWQRMDRAVEKIQQRLEKTVAALSAANIPYAIIGGNAVRAWVAQVDEAAVRTTRDVDILVRREDFERMQEAMASAGFTYRHVRGIDMFLDGPDAKARDAVHICFAAEKVHPDNFTPAPDVTETVQIQSHNTLTLEALVCMKLNAFRDKDRMHLRDMLDVELIDDEWPKRFPAPLSERLQQLIDDPTG